MPILCNQRCRLLIVYVFLLISLLINNVTSDLSDEANNNSEFKRNSNDSVIIEDKLVGGGEVSNDKGDADAPDQSLLLNESGSKSTTKITKTQTIVLVVLGSMFGIVLIIGFASVMVTKFGKKSEELKQGEIDEDEQCSDHRHPKETQLKKKIYPPFTSKQLSALTG